MNKINTIKANHKLYQQRLSQLADPPKNLYYFGELLCLQKPSIAIVGSRRPTPYGHEITYKLSFDLAKKGVTIISGLAYGVDSVAHQAALDAGGATVAVLAGGLHDIYPQRHTKLAQHIVEKGGCLISEYPLGTPCLPHQFIARNRIIAALADGGVLITEAALKSGSLHTADFALDLGRQVMAVPGQATNPNAAGCLRLLQNGAGLVTNVQDIFECLGWQCAPQAQLALDIQNPNEAAILRALANGAQKTEELLQLCGLSVANLQQTLTQLEIAKKITRLGSGHWIMGE